MCSVWSVFTERKCYYIVCALTGIKGSELDIELNEVNIYNTRYIKKFDFESNKSIEVENINEKEIHVSAKVESIDIEYAKKMAEEKIEKAIDVICCYSASKVPIKIDFTDVIVLNENKKIVSTSFNIEGTEFEREVKGLNFDYDNVEELEKLYENYSGSVLKCTTRIAEIIQDSSRWYRKGEDIKRKEDKLMNYWISLENLIPKDMILPEEIKKIKGGKDNKFMIAYSVIPELFIKKHIMDELWVYYMHFYNKYKYKNSNIPKELKDKCQFGYRGEINILYFIKSIDELIANEKKEFDKDLLQNVKDKITSNTKNFIQNIITKERNVILLSYRMRNMIVHNAKCNMYFNEYYIYNLRNYTRELFYLIVEEYNKNPNDTVEDIIYRQYIQQKETDFNKINIMDFINDYMSE